jgi:hypothetical protein
MLSVFLLSAAHPAIERSLSGIVNSRESKLTLSFCVSLKRKTACGPCPLDDVDRAGVGPRDEAALLEDDAEQLVDVANRRHGARDVDELARARNW